MIIATHLAVANLRFQLIYGSKANMARPAKDFTFLTKFGYSRQRQSENCRNADYETVKPTGRYSIFHIQGGLGRRNWSAE